MPFSQFSSSPYERVTYHTLEDENPPPTSQAMLAIQLHQAKGKNTG
jgi:hypothetical protein